MITEEQQEKIDEIMDYFDFGRVHKVMKMLNWSWHDEGVPEKQELKACARKLLKDLAEKPIPKEHKNNWNLEASLGGFTAKRFGRMEGREPWEHFSLIFYIDFWSTDG
jgi:hypothetical protein